MALHTPIVLVIRDGWGHNPDAGLDRYNAIKQARTPATERLLATYPWTLIHTSGEAVGLPEGTMGNSEVGHQNMGAGRIVDQDSGRISKAIRVGDFYENPVLREAVERAKSKGGAVHLMGLASDAGVHSLMEHLYACLELCKRMGQREVVVHAFTDGRDVGPFTGVGLVGNIVAKCKEIGVGKVASISGRYWAMDRDNRWSRVERAYNMLTGRGEAVANYPDVASAMQDYYERPTNESQKGDEFITPRTVGADWKGTRVKDGDSVIFFNYRGDRPREITRAFVMDKFEGEVKAAPDTGQKGFDRGKKLDLFYVTMTEYDSALNPMVHVAFRKPPKIENIAGEWLAKKGLRQFRCAETEKFPHVTFFFNDYRNEPFEGEDREFADSPKVATYDLKPAMSAEAVRDMVLGALEREYALIVVNFANGDMVGHTGNIEAAKAAIEVVDGCVGAIAEKTLAKGGALVITADHGNAEQEYDPATGSAHTAHTTYDVDCIVVDKRFAGKRVKLREGGNLADIIPTCFDLMGLEKPGEMTGRSLIVSA